MPQSGMLALKSFQSFQVNDGLLGQVVEAVKAGEKEARSTGDIQTFEVFYKGFRQNIAIGRVMVIPAKVADSRETFPIALLYGTIMKECFGEEAADLITYRIGDTEFDEYSKADLASLKDKIFKNKETGKYDSIVIFAPAWLNQREYVHFRFTKDDEKLTNLVRHLIFSAYFNPALSSAFNALMTDVSTDKLDVVNITPKLNFPGIAENPLKDYPDFQKMGANRAKKIFLTLKTADAITKEQLEPAELDVFDALNNVVEKAMGVKPIKDVAKHQGSLKKVAYVEHVPGHKNSQGEAAPWVIKQHNTGKILSSHKSEAEAKKHLRDMEAHKHGSDEVKDVDLGSKGDFKVHENALHEALGIPADQKIPMEKLHEVMNSDDYSEHVKDMARSAIGLKSMHHSSSKQACGELPVVEGTNVGPGTSAANQEPPTPKKEDLRGPEGSKPLGIELNSDGTAKREEKGKEAATVIPRYCPICKKDYKVATAATKCPKGHEFPKNASAKQAEQEECPKCHGEGCRYCNQKGYIVKSSARKSAGTITLANPTQVALYKGMLIGQMSDGFWEDKGPRDHWRPMAQADVRVGKPGMDFTPRRPYGFVRELIPLIGEELLTLARATKAYPNVDWVPLAHAITYIADNNVEDLKADWQQKYVQAVLQATGESDIAQVLAKINGQAYSMQDLRRDLRAIQEVINGKVREVRQGVFASVVKQARDRDERMNYKGHDLHLTTWEERDNLAIDLVDESTGMELGHWVDDEAREMFEDGFFNARNLIGSVVEYLESVGALKDLQPIQEEEEWNEDHGEHLDMPEGYTASSAKFRQAAREHVAKISRNELRKKIAEEVPSADNVLNEVLTDMGQAPAVDLPNEASPEGADNRPTAPEAKVPSEMKSEKPEETKAEAKPEQAAKPFETTASRKLADVMDILESYGRFGRGSKMGAEIAQDIAEAKGEVDFNKAEVADNSEADQDGPAEHFAAGPKPNYTEEGILPEGTSDAAKKHFFNEPTDQAEMRHAVQCMDCGHIGPANVHGGCEKCQSQAVTEKIYKDKEPLSMAKSVGAAVKQAVEGERHDDVPVSQGEAASEKQPVSDLKDGAPEAHDVPPQVDKKTATENQFLQLAQEAIEADDPIIYDVAAEHGQIVDNVKHMSWFVKAVAEALEEDSAQ